jgi:hypothetical protein
VVSPEVFFDLLQVFMLGGLIVGQLRPVTSQLTHGSRLARRDHFGTGSRAGQAGQGERRESATDVRLDGDEIAADADDGDAGHATGTYMGSGTYRGRVRLVRTLPEPQ